MECGRPAWLAQRAHEVRAAHLRVFGVDSPGVYRCIVTLETRNGEFRFYTLDVAKRDFDALPALSRRQLIELANSLLDQAAHVPVE